MHTVDLLEQALQAAQRLGYKIRQEWLGGSGGGGCQIHGQKWIFLDLAQSPQDQLDQVAEALRGEQAASDLLTEPRLQNLLRLKKSA